MFNYISVWLCCLFNWIWSSYYVLFLTACWSLAPCLYLRMKLRNIYKLYMNGLELLIDVFENYLIDKWAFHWDFPICPHQWVIYLVLDVHILSALLKSHSKQWFEKESLNSFHYVCRHAWSPHQLSWFFTHSAVRRAWWLQVWVLFEPL